MATKRSIKKKQFFVRLFNWEYWPGHWLYLPLTPYFLYLALRYRHPCFFTAANPGVYTGGLGMESKFQTLLLIPEALRPRSLFVPGAQLPEETIRNFRHAGMAFPVIVKPDIGYRGLLVKKIDSEEALLKYLRTYPIDFIVQEFSAYPEEVGVLYYRFPNEAKGHITSVTQKIFLSVTGDGRSTLRELVEKNPRALLQMDRLQEETPEMLEQIPAAGDVVPLGVVGNHSKGTTFINGNHLIDQALLNTFDKLSELIPGFNYGRYDLKCNSFAELREGKNFKIIELNGVCSEPTHIYDAAKMSYFKALSIIARHWTIIGKLAGSNHKKGMPYMAPLPMIRAILDLRKYNRTISRLSG